MKTSMGLVDCSADATEIVFLGGRELSEWTSGNVQHAAHLRQAHFTGEARQVLFLAPNERRKVLYGVGDRLDRWTAAAAAATLPPGTYRLADSTPSETQTAVAVGWAAGAYRFHIYKSGPCKPPAQLCWPPRADRRRAEREIEARVLVRNLINTPSNDMGPAELADAARDVAKRHSAQFNVITGDELLSAGFPLVHAVGRASVRPPRLIELRWGPENAPTVAIVGKGVCFDSGGLNIKTKETMLLMKKDMGGAAHALALSLMVMDAGLPLRIRVVIPAVENAVGGSAYRPLDVIRSRKGLSVEIGNTDAEGRLILADALAAACEEQPRLVIDFATLTSAARVALGPEVSALFSNDDELAAAFERAARQTGDSLWRLPLWRPYLSNIEGRVADLASTTQGTDAGAIHAALFLNQFVGDVPWAHLDIYGWNSIDRAGRPEGAEVHALGAAYRVLENVANGESSI